MHEAEIPDFNLFMMCGRLDHSALSELPAGYTLRTCRPDELALWKAFPFDSDQVPPAHAPFMDQFVRECYGAQMELFFARTLFVCTEDDTPVATCSSWKAYGQFESIHWFKTRKAYEGRGLGRALLSVVMQRFAPDDYPIYLHTQPGSFRAIKLYAEMGFQLLRGGPIGTRANELEASLPILQAFMPSHEFARLRITETPAALIRWLERETTVQF